MKWVTLFLTGCLWVTHSLADIHISPGKLHNYYHLRLKLKADNFELSLPNSMHTPKYSEDNSYTFSDGGQFEVFIKKEALPASVDTQVASHYIILRMPYTRPDLPGASMFIREKKRLFDEIKALKSAPLESMSVVVELNPYIDVLSRKPLKLKLSEPNIFFRQAYGRYINYTGNLKIEDQNQNQ